MLTDSDAFNLVRLETEFNAAAESRNAACEAADSAEFRYRATLEVCEHAINLKNALKKNRFHENETAFAPFIHSLIEMQLAAQAINRTANAAYEFAHNTAQTSFHALQEARKSAAFITPPHGPGMPNELGLNDI